ncbi:MAG: hypothetical protein KGL39_21035 [Patescibacteria group bacterium]|nr:hypothetical protein [Patescibacteria group bacterium]
MAVNLKPMATAATDGKILGWISGEKYEGSALRDTKEAHAVCIMARYSRPVRGHLTLRDSAEKVVIDVGRLEGKELVTLVLWPRRVKASTLHPVMVPVS